MKEITGNINAAEKKFCIVLSRFNDIVGNRLLEGTADCLKRHGVDDDNMTLIRVPGAFEIPLIAERAARTGKYDAIICLGAVVRGNTAHFDLVASEVTRGIGKISLEQNLPVIFGVLTTETMEQAMDRSGGKLGNKGWDAAMTAMEMANLVKL